MKNETAADLPSQCRPGNNDVDDGDVDNGDDDGDDDGNGDDCDGDGDETTTVPSHTSTKPTAVSTNHVSSHTTALTTQSTGTSNFIGGGVITYFFQNGVAGACGTVHQDTDMICALDSARYNNGEFCGREITIEANDTTGQKRIINVTVADECPTCKNSNSIDLSLGAFEQITATAIGELSAIWSMHPAPTPT